MKLAISGSSGKTGFRVAEQALKKGITTKLLIRSGSILPESLSKQESFKVSLNKAPEIDEALSGSDALIIATGARPNIDLTGPARIDACGVRNQIESCKRTGVKRVILVSSLCAGKFFHPLNLFGLILIWKRIGEQFLENSGLDWTIIRPGGLNEKEDELNKLGIIYTSQNNQEEGSIPRRLVAETCVDALLTPKSIGKIIEITSDENTKQESMEKSLERFNINQTNLIN